MSTILVRAKIATEIKALSTREQWPDSAVSQLTILKNITMFFMVGVLQLLHEKFLLFCPVDLIGLSCV